MKPKQCTKLVIPESIKYLKIIDGVFSTRHLWEIVLEGGILRAKEELFHY